MLWGRGRGECGVALTITGTIPSEVPRSSPEVEEQHGIQEEPHTDVGGRFVKGLLLDDATGG